MAEAPQAPTHVLVDGTLLVVPPEVQLPARCLRCGTRKQVHYHPSTFVEGSNAAGSSGGVGGALGATEKRAKPAAATAPEPAFEV